MDEKVLYKRQSPANSLTDKWTLRAIKITLLSHHLHTRYQSDILMHIKGLARLSVVPKENKCEFQMGVLPQDAELDNPVNGSEDPA